MRATGRPSCPEEWLRTLPAGAALPLPGTRSGSDAAANTDTASDSGRCACCGGKGASPLRAMGVTGRLDDCAATARLLPVTRSASEGALGKAGAALAARKPFRRESDGDPERLWLPCCAACCSAGGAADGPAACCGPCNNPEGV